MKEIPGFLNKEGVELCRKYGLVIVLLYYLVGPGIKDGFRTIVREEIKPLVEEIAALRIRVASLETKRP